MPSNAKRIVLIMPPTDSVDNDRLEAPLGLLYIAAVLRENHYLNVCIYDMSGCRNEEEIAKSILSIPHADVYGITVFCSNHRYAQKCITEIRKINPVSTVIVGGPNPSALPEVTLEELQPDYVVVGEGEDAFVQVLRTLDTGQRSLPNILFGYGRADIDSYPLPARDLVDNYSYNKKLNDQHIVSMITSRGCKNSCLHCNSIVMGGGSSGVRYRSVKSICEEIQRLKTAGHRYIRFVDDNFTSNPNIEALLQELTGFDVRFRAHGRIEDLNRSVCRLLKEAGCVHITIGLESLNPDNLRVLGKAGQIDMLNNVGIAKGSGLTVRSSFMVGLPYDSDQNIDRYFREAAQLPFDEFEVIPLIPFPGTRISRSPERWGYQIIDNDFRSYVLIGKNRKTTFALKHKNFSVSDVVRWRKSAEEILKSAGKCYMKDSRIAR